jgi:hypothetical protein
VIRLLMFLTISAAATLSAAQPGLSPPRDLAAMFAKARVEGTLASWCRGQFRAGRPSAYAAALTLPTGGGRYLVLDGEAAVVELASFKSAPDLACYTPAEARKLHEAIQTTETVSGRIAPRFTTTVVCAFVEETNAVCWQYSPAARAFIKVGEWQT